MIKDRLIEVDLGEALALAGIGETVRCVGEGTGIIDLEDALEGLTFFVLEGKLAAREKPEPIKMCMTPPKAAASYDTPESRTRAIIDSVERYDEEHEAERKETKQEALAKEYGGEEVPAPVPFAEAPTGGR